MLDTDERFEVNTAVAVWKVYEDEALVLNTATGRYFDLEGSAPDVWGLLEQGATAREAAAVLAGRYEVDEDQALAHVQELLERLLDEDLVRRADGPALATPDPCERAAYVRPALTGFTDMEELLAADPPLPADYTPVWDDRQSS